LAIELQRVYHPAGRRAGTRVLVDRVWPRGVKKENLRLDRWMKDLAPSTPLRKWFGHDPRRWEEFRRRYRAELGQPEKQELLAELRRLARSGSLVLLYGARDQEHNQAVVLREYLESRSKSSR
jgi:uncharacterized protein YeaO (DUF488 family)